MQLQFILITIIIAGRFLPWHQHCLGNIYILANISGADILLIWFSYCAQHNIHTCRPKYPNAETDASFRSASGMYLYNLAYDGLHAPHGSWEWRCFTTFYVYGTVRYTIFLSSHICINIWYLLQLYSMCLHVGLNVNYYRKSIVKMLFIFLSLIFIQKFHFFL